MVRTLECPNCGGSVQIKYERTLNAVCIQCLSILDATTPSLQILQTAHSKLQRHQPKIPLGQRGKLPTGDYEAIGFQVRGITVGGVSYNWAEYLLYNPYKGYRYLSEYNGHWNDIRTLRALPRPAAHLNKKAVAYGGQRYTHFQTADARTLFVMGEFPWQVRVGETVKVEDYIAPPVVLSSEETDGEITWSIGQYTPPDTIWKAFALSGAPPTPMGIYANQPSPYKGSPRGIWARFGLFLLAMLTVMFLIGVAVRPQQVFKQKYTFMTGMGEPSFVTSPFRLQGGEGNVAVSVKTDLNNDWAYFSFALINEDTGVAYDFGKEVSYYYGRDSDGNWSEGDRNETVIVSGVRGGSYYLRVEPDMSKDGGPHSVSYELVVERGKPRYFWYLFAFLGLLIPPVVTSIRTFSFENLRWAESDYGPLVQSSSDSEDD
jgi:hypothetical protein